MTFNAPLKTALPLLTLGVVIALGSSSHSNTFEKEDRMGFPNEFAAHFHGVTVPEGETESGYKTGYRRNTLARMKLLKKYSGADLPWVERGPGNVGGRTRGLVIDAADPTGNTWLAGSVGGGIWRTEDGGQNWTATTDDAPRLSISSIAQCAADPSILYAGTGEGYFNLDASIGDGIFKSTDGGRSWGTLESTTGGRDFLFVNRVIVSPTDPDLVLAAARSGLWRSMDGGASWEQVKTATSGLGFYQIIEDPSDFTIQYAVEDRVGVWKSIDAGASWTLASTDLAEANSGSRIEIDVSPANPSVLYALVESRGGVDPTYVSQDGAASWQPFLPAAGSADTDIAGTQGWYDLAVHAHPFDEHAVFMGGIRMYRLQAQGIQNVRSFSGVEEDGTESFLTFVNFGANHLGGGLRLGTEEEESTIGEDEMVSVEVRFGPGRTQKAHRFVPPDQGGVDFVDYPYADFVDVPFEVWDITNNQQLHVSFRDREDNGTFDLEVRNDESIDREYVLISSRTYSDTPNFGIAQNGGVRNDLMYFFWPMLVSGTWDPDNLPESTLRFNYTNTDALTRELNAIAGRIHVDQHVMRSFPTGSEGNAFKLVVGNDGGVYYSGDGGINWIGRFRGYNTTQFYGVDKKPGRSIYLGGTQDNGSWRSLGDPGPASAWFEAGFGDGFDVIWHKQNDQQLITTSQFTNIRRSLNGGASFQSAMTGMTDTGSECGCSQFLVSLSSRPDNSNVVYTLGKTGVWRSSNFAGSWEARPIPEEDWGYVGSGTVHVSNADGNVVWAGYEMDPTAGSSDFAGHLHRSTDDGDTFVAMTTPLWGPGRLTGINSSFEDPETVYVTFGFFNRPKVIRSRDGGTTWEDLSGFLGASNADVVSPNGFPDVAVFDVLDFPDSPIIWAATEIGLVESTDDGQTWHLADNGLPAVSIWQMRLLDDEVVLATHGRGVWTLPVTAVVTSTEETTQLPELFEVTAAWPNPFQDRVTVSWTSPVATHLRAEVFDMQGRRVAILRDGPAQAGSHEVTWQAESIPAGAYVVRLTGDDGSRTRMIIKGR
ncbi:MAG: T9SS type A sorting domain-containing protein [Bacteroidota bacterium]|nr:T9SS type A sorting domain-containing protein [Bacteroidota bacterium]